MVHNTAGCDLFTRVHTTTVRRRSSTLSRAETWEWRVCAAAAIYATGGRDFTGSIARIQEAEAELRDAHSPLKQTPMRPSAARFPFMGGSSV